MEDFILPGGITPLNIKNDEAHEYAKKLASLTGKSITELVTDVLSCS
jgi:hypothetical protein